MRFHVSILGLVLSGISIAFFLACPLGIDFMNVAPWWAVAISAAPTLMGLLIDILRSKKKEVIVSRVATVFLGSESLHNKELVTGKKYTVGSDPKDSFSLQLPSVNPKQLTITVKSDHYLVENVNCNFDVHLNRQKLKKEKVYKAFDGDTIQMGKIKVSFSKEIKDADV